MGSFAGHYGNMTIPEERREEFSRNILAIARAGGMMACDGVRMFGKQLLLYTTPEFDDDRRMWFNMSYIGDSWWEDAGYNAKDGHVFSGKVGSPFAHFAKVVRALYQEFHNTARSGK